MILNRLLGRIVILLEKLVMWIVFLCGLSYIGMNIFEGIQVFLLSTSTSTLTSIYFLVVVVVNLISSVFVGVFQITNSIVLQLRNATYVSILQYLYLRGPSWYGYGFWNGKLPEEICGQITGATVLHWSKNLDECNILIKSQVNSLVVIVEFIVMTFLTYKYLNDLWPRIKLFTGLGST